MAKNHNAPKLPPATAPGAAAPEPVPPVPTAPEGATSAEQLPAAPADPGEGADVLQSPDAATQASGTPEEPAETNAPQPPAPPAPEAKARFRVNWHFAGFRKEDLLEGDEVEATEHEAAPFLGGVLTRIEDVH